MNIFRSQLRQELTVMARNGEQLLLLVGIPVLLMVFFSQIDILPTQGLTAVAFLVPGILALALMSTAMVSLGIATGFERSYGVLKRLGTTPLGTRRLVLAKVVATCIVESAQLALLVVVGIALGWRPVDTNWLAATAAVVLGTTCFAGIGLTLAGRLRAEVNLAAQNGLYLMLLLLGGIIVPNDELPKVVRSLAEWLPSNALSELLRSAFNGYEIVVRSIVVLLVWSVATCALATIYFKWSD
ncbi:MAG: ABC transporter permease [Actinobacteria bacterium]|nr:ABC transporter permease [Actinomycetota bacterium]